MEIFSKRSKKEIEQIFRRADEKVADIVKKYPKLWSIAVFSIGYLACILGKVFFVMLFVGALIVLGIYLALPEDKDPTGATSSENGEQQS